MTKQRSGRLSIIPAAAIFDHRLSHADIRVLAALGAHADKDGRCWPAVPTLAQKIGLSQRHVHRCLQALSKCGVVEIEKRLGQSRAFGFATMTLARTRPPVRDVRRSGRKRTCLV